MFSWYYDIGLQRCRLSPYSTVLNKIDLCSWEKKSILNHRHLNSILSQTHWICYCSSITNVHFRIKTYKFFILMNMYIWFIFFTNHLPNPCAFYWNVFLNRNGRIFTCAGMNQIMTISQRSEFRRVVYGNRI